MPNRIRHISRTLLLLMLWIALASVTPRGLIAADTPPDVPASYQLAAENDQFQLYVDSTTLAFKLWDKRSSYLWHSGIDELVTGDRLNKSWRAFAQSGVSIEYLDEKAISKRISIANATHTLDVTPITQGVTARLTFQDFGITLGLSLTLEADGVRVEVPYTTITEDNPQFRLGQIYLYPFLGATRGGSVPGYMFLPDGTGSLIQLADTTKAKNMFYGRYYGDDLGMLGVMPYDIRTITPGQISFPVFGMVHGEGQNAYIAVIEKGESYAEVQVHPSGILTNFNFLYNTFIYNQSYFQATNRSGAGVTTVQKQPNAFDTVVHYRFLTADAANYVGMARSYQQYLIATDRLHKADLTNPDIGIRLEFLGGDKEKILFWYRFITMTTINQMSAILSDLKIPNPEVIYYGWQPFGASSMPPTNLNLEGSLGSIDDLRTLAQSVTTGGGHFALYLEPQAAYWEESGYNPRTELAMAITKVNLEGFNRLYGFYFSLNPLQERFAALSSDIAAHLPAGLALDGIGAMLYTDFRDSTPLNREAAISAYQSFLSKSPVRLGFYRPNDYLFGVAQAYYDMPLGDNGYIYTSESVPFLPIVLAGYIPYYSTPLNFSSNLQEDLLHQVEFGIYPSYFLTQEPTSTMLNTRSAWIYSSSYAQWGNQIRTSYAWMNALLAPVRGQQIIAHQKLADGVYATTYANHRQIIVNYNDQPVTHNGNTIGAKNALLLETTP